MENQCLEGCAQYVAQQEKKLPPYHRLHLFYELPESNDQGNASNAQQESTIQYALHCLHSLYVYFENCPHNGPAKISSEIGLFHTRRTGNQLKRIYTPSSSHTRLESADQTDNDTTPSGTLEVGTSDGEPGNAENNVNEKEFNKDFIQTQYNAALVRLQTDKTMLPWFPSDYEVPEVIDVDNQSPRQSSSQSAIPRGETPTEPTPDDNNLASQAER